MPKTKLKIIIFTFFVLYGGVFTAFSAMAAEISSESVIKLVNQEREKKGLSPLVENENLSRAAREKARDMIKKDYFAHTSPEGLTPWHWIEKNGYDYKFAGENLAINFRNAENQNKAWMESAEHRKNILNPQFNEIGVAVVKGKLNGGETIVTVQQFGSRGVSAATLAAEKKKAGEVKAAASPESEPVPIEEVFPSDQQESQAIFIENSIKPSQPESKDSFAKWGYPVATLIFLLAVFVASEVLRKIREISSRREVGKGALPTISMEEYRNLAQIHPLDIGKMQIVYLNQMKQRE